MAALAKSGTPSLCTDTPCDANRIGPLLVGEDIGAGDACYVKSDGKWWKSNGAAGQTTAAEVDGYAPTAAKVAQRQTLTCYRNCNFRYGAALTPGARYFLSETVTGGLQTTVATSAQAKAIGFAVDDTRIRLVPTT
jgi:hypothetical protein